MLVPCLSIFSSHQSGRWSHGISGLRIEAGTLAARAGVALAGAVAATVTRVVPLRLLLLPLVARKHVLVLTLRAGILLLQLLLVLSELLALLPTMCRAFAAAVLGAAIRMQLLLMVPLAVAVRSARVVRALRGALVDLMTRGSGLHLIAMGMANWLIPALHWRRQWRWLHGRGQCITAVAGSVVVGAACGTQACLVLADCVSLRGIVDMYVAGSHVASARSGKVGRQGRRMLACGCDLITILCATDSTERIAIQILLGTANGALWRHTPGGEATRRAAVYGGVQNAAE